MDDIWTVVDEIIREAKRLQKEHGRGTIPFIPDGDSIYIALLSFGSAQLNKKGEKK